jgi:pimeloyl-ACP methyl ester carboxylesterase
VAIRTGRVLADGRDTDYAEAGNGPPVILSPGLGLTARFYRQNLEAFAHAGLRLIVPSAPGHGRTGGNLLGMDVPSTARWLAAFARKLQLSHAGWMGHSVGAQSALLLAAEHPELAAGLVLVGPTGSPGRFRRLRELGALARTTRRESLPVLLSVAREYLHVSPLRYLGTWARAANDDPVEHAARVRCPVLVLVGNRDPVPPRDYVELLRQRIRNARVDYIAGGAHGLPHERADEFNRLATEFFRQVLQ